MNRDNQERLPTNDLVPPPRHDPRTLANDVPRVPAVGHPGDRP